MARRRNDYSREDFPGENFGSMGSGMRVNGSSSSSSGGGGGGGADGFVSLSSFASMSFDDARRSMNPVLRHSQQEARLPNIIHIAEDNSARHINQRNVVRRQGATPPLMDSLFSGLGRAGLRVPAPLADSQSSRGLESARSTRSNFDEYEALGMLDEGIVKRGVSEQKIRSLRVGPIQRRGVGEDKCHICQLEWGGGDSSMHLPCKHHFHEECIRGWFKENRTCPVCRFEVEK